MRIMHGVEPSPHLISMPEIILPKTQILFNQFHLHAPATLIRLHGLRSARYGNGIEA
jgi:hypothetical protein